MSCDWTYRKFLVPNNITSELFLILHFEAKNSVTPILFLLKSMTYLLDNLSSQERFY